MTKEQLSYRRQLFPYGYEGRFNFSNEINSEKLREISLLLYTKLIDPLTTQKKTSNLRGRDYTLLLDPDCPSEHRFKEDEELFYLSGKIKVEIEAEDSEDDEATFESVPFSFRTRSVFKELQKIGYINYTVETSSKGPVSSDKIIDTLKLPDLEIEYLRIGLLFMRPSYFSNMIGSAPIVREQILIDSSSNKFQIELKANGLREKSTELISDQEIKGSLSEILLNCFRTNIP